MLGISLPLHHAYSVAGDASLLVPEILSALLRTIGFKARGNPDFRQEHYEVMGIDEARALKEAAERTAVTGGRKVFIVSVQGMTKEAQNALLKIVEEPPPDTHFFLILPTLELLLPTLRSRLSILRADDSRDEAQTLAERGAAFLKAAPPARLKTVQALLKEREETESTEMILTFLDSLEYALAACLRQGSRGQAHERQENTGALAELMKAKKYSRDRAPSFKLLLEHLALVLPVSVIPAKAGIQSKTNPRFPLSRE